MKNPIFSRSQKGSGDSGTILIIFGACCVLSVVLIVFSWMGDSLEARRNQRNGPEEVASQNYEPFGYEVVYSRGLSGFSQDH